jgi:general secretion pathway protein K
MTDRHPITPTVHCRSAQRGVALITAILIVAIVATVAMFVGLHQQIWLRQTQNLMDRAQATAIHQGSLSWASQILAKDAKDSKTDDLTEDWAKPLPPLPVEGGVVVAGLSDAQARFNLNNLVQKNGNPDKNHGAVFRRLLELQDLNPGLTEAVIDWLDGDARTSPNGAEDIDYLNNDPPYRAANQALVSVEELRLIKGFSIETIDKLAPYVVALPATTAINVNTASSVVLAALVPNLPLTDAERIVSERDKKPFNQPADFEKLLPAGQTPTQGTYGVQSAHFFANLNIQIGRLTHRTEALLQRPTGGQAVHTLWQRPRIIQIKQKKEDGLS